MPAPSSEQTVTPCHPMRTRSVLGKRHRQPQTVRFNETDNRTFQVPRWSKAITRITPLNRVDRLWLQMYNYKNMPDANWDRRAKRAKLHQIAMKLRDMRAALALLQLHRRAC